MEKVAFRNAASCSIIESGFLAFHHVLTLKLKFNRSNLILIKGVRYDCDGCLKSGQMTMLQKTEKASKLHGPEITPLKSHQSVLKENIILESYFFFSQRCEMWLILPFLVPRC